MKFNKVLIIGIRENSLDSSYWDRIKNATDAIVQLPKDSSDFLKETQLTEKDLK